ncbi:hypothetical protein POM88_033227 [Heracleum sosnowskyi]|uniref:Uncharacterized protein n=1 Tax=Heracleum sosnowskyi TaxID=360622 RepID=A0AAD8I0U1_9APIA|nr:hypothetical protein POM88_033227 [Heracleum sosnowskyi]
MGVKVCPDNAQVIDEHKKAEKDRREAHTKTLDDLVNVNSLFTLAVFVGLSQASPGAISLENKEECNAGPGVAKMLVLYEVVAFCLFPLIKPCCETSSSVSGIILLTLSVVNIVQVRIGLYSCASVEARRAIWALCTIVAIALMIYVVSLIIAIYASITTDGQYSSSSKENSDKKSGDMEKDDRFAGSVEGH